MVYADFESILLPEDNGKQNPEESYTKKDQNTLPVVSCKLECVNGKFSKPFKPYLGIDVVYNFINNRRKLNIVVM